MQDIIQTLVGYSPIILMGVLFYFILYRPQKQEQQRRANMLSSLKKGDRIITIGGLYGTILDLDDTVIKLKIAEKVEVEISRSAVSCLQNTIKEQKE